MSAAELFAMIEPLVLRWNADHHQTAALRIIQDEDVITISPVKFSPCFHFSGTLLNDIACLALVYDFSWGIHFNAQGSPYILL